MYLSDLPTLYDLSTPSSNLAAAEPGDLSFDLTPLDKYRLTFGEGLIPGGIGAAFGYKNFGMLGGVLGAFIGYMAPLPAVGFILLKAGSDMLAIPTAMEGFKIAKDYSPTKKHGFVTPQRRCRRFIRVRGKLKCVKWQTVYVRS